MVVNRITWLDEVVYTSVGKLASYEELSIPLFVQVYLIIVMKSEKETVRAKMASHLEDLMGDVERYGWERFRAYRGVWLKQLE